MNVRKYVLATALCVAALYSCGDDDDNNDIEIVPPRDRAEQQANEDPLIVEYLKTHFYTSIENTANSDYETVVFDTIAGNNSGKTSMWDSGQITSKTITLDEVDYKLYFLKFNEGTATEYQPTFADSTLVTYRGEQFYDNRDKDGDGIPDGADVDSDGDGVPETDTIDNNSVTRTDADNDGIADFADVDTEANKDKLDSDGDGIIDDEDDVDNTNSARRVFDSAVRPQWFNQISVIQGWREAVSELRGASGQDLNDDGTTRYTMDFGNIVVFMPSGLAYFNSPPTGSGIGAYKSLIFHIQLYKAVQADHDQDGIPSFLEDIDKDTFVINDNTDSDVAADFDDTDDDQDGVPTSDEITVNDRDGNGIIEYNEDPSLSEIIFYDDDGDGIFNHLDTDDTEVKN